MRRLLITSVSAAALGALAAAMPASAADFEPVQVPPSFYNWSGFYLGGQIGYADLEPNPTAPNQVQPESDGIMGGAHAGFNFQPNNMLVLGIEGDFSGVNLDDSAPCANPVFTCNAGADWIASVRGRAGIAFDRLMVYGTGGIAFLEYDGFTRNAVATFRDSDTLTGWTAGAGVEYAWTDTVSVGAEVRYSDFETKTMNFDVPYTVDPDAFTVGARVSIKLGEVFSGN